MVDAGLGDGMDMHKDAVHISEKHTAARVLVE